MRPVTKLVFHKPHDCVYLLHVQDSTTKQTIVCLLCFGHLVDLVLPLSLLRAKGGIVLLAF